MAREMKILVLDDHAEELNALLKNLQDQNSIYNNDNRTNYRNLLRNPTQGVKAKGAF